MTYQQYIQQAVIKIKFEDGDVPFGYVADPTPGELNNKTVDMVDCLVFREAGVIVRGSDIKTSWAVKIAKEMDFASASSLSATISDPFRDSYIPVRVGYINLLHHSGHYIYHF